MCPSASSAPRCRHRPYNTECPSPRRTITRSTPSADAADGTPSGTSLHVAIRTRFMRTPDSPRGAHATGTWCARRRSAHGVDARRPAFAGRERFVQRAALHQPRREPFGRDRLAEVVALRDVTLERGQRLPRDAVLHTL